MSDAYSTRHQINYQKLVNDMETKKPASKPVKSYTRDQQEILKQVQNYVLRQDKSTKLAISCKERDQTNSGFLNQARLPEILGDHKIELSSHEMMTFKSCLTYNKNGEFKIQELLELLCGIEEGLKLSFLDLEALKPGAGPKSSIKPIEFKVPY